MIWWCGTDGDSDGESGLDFLRDVDESGLDFLRDEDGNSDESSRCQVDDGATLHLGRRTKMVVRSGDGGAGLMGKVVISLSESDMM
ncbi:hypothetical protein Tco_1299644, partial [Tanacetum coccineum]